MPAHQITLQGQRFHLRTWGRTDAPRLLMLHGFPEYSGAWEDLATRLSDRFYCIAPDQRGYGQSWCPAEVGHYTTSALVSDMVALIGDAPLTVLGHDWGAAVAYGLAINAPECVTRLIVMNGVHPLPFMRALAAGGAQSAASQYIPFLRSPDAEDALAADDFAKLRRLFGAHMDMSWLRGARAAAYAREWARPGRLTGMLNWYRASPFPVARPGAPLTELPALDPAKLRVTCPHLLIWGAEDTALLPEATEGLEELCDDLIRVEIAGADHWLHHQKPQAVAQVIRDWFCSDQPKPEI
ncbi:MAG: alpha/beta hydrolase [Pseudomonadota bacterium]